MTANIPRGAALLAIVGPTAVGKSKIALIVSSQIPVEIISVDSMQVYLGMDIGTGKPTSQELEAVAHHMVDIVYPTEEFSVAVYKRMADEAITRIIERGNFPLLVGGSGLYFRAVVDDLSFPSSGGCGSSLRKYLESLSNEELSEMISECDPVSAENIPTSNKRRMVRALEVALGSNRTVSERQISWTKYQSPYNLVAAGIEMERKFLYELIDRRVDTMIEKGIVEETRALIESGLKPGTTAGEALGYRELTAYLKGEVSLEQAVAEIKKKTRRFAKRQLTWFKRDPRIVWFSVAVKTGMSEEELKKAIEITASEVIEYFRGRLDNIK